MKELSYFQGGLETIALRLFKTAFNLVNVVSNCR